MPDETGTIMVGPHEVGPYRTVKGHHPHQQAARSDNPNYDPNTALTMRDDGTFDHGIVSRTQQIMNAEARRSGEPYSLDVEESIQRAAMKKGGVADQDIERILELSRENLKKQGALDPTRTPGSRKEKKIE